jgi:hypothetical protein
MASLVQSIFSARVVLVCFGLLPGASSGAIGFLWILALFVLFLVPFDRRFIDWYVRRVSAAPEGTAPSRGGTHYGKRMLGDGLSETPISEGPNTRRLCEMLDLEVVVLRDLSSSDVGSRLVALAIGRWNEEAWEFEVVTEWCETWEDLEEEALQAVKSFRGLANAN